MDVKGEEEKKSCQALILGGKMTALVKKLPIEKVGKVSKCGINCYVNGKCIILAAHPVEKPCGELCGKCGKVPQRNRTLPTSEPPMGWINFCIKKAIIPMASLYVTENKRKPSVTFWRKSW